MGRGNEDGRRNNASIYGGTTIIQHGALRLDVILEGLTSFAQTYEGVLTTETMLIKSVNNDIGGIRQVSHFLKKAKANWDIIE